MTQKPRVIGVYHTIKNPDHNKVMDYVRETITHKEIVAVESPWNLDRILRDGKNNPRPDYRFLYTLCDILRSIGAKIKPVEDQKLYGKCARLKGWYIFEEEEELEKDKRWQRLSILRSIRLLELAQEENSDCLITGMMHAYDLERMGHQPVVFLSKIPLKLRQKEDSWIELYEKSLE